MLKKLKILLKIFAKINKLRDLINYKNILKLTYLFFNKQINCIASGYFIRLLIIYKCILNFKFF